MSTIAMSTTTNPIEVSERRFDLDGPEIAPDLNEAMRRRIAARLRDLYAPVAEAALPVEHVDLLLALRHKERDRLRAGREAA